MKKFFKVLETVLDFELDALLNNVERLMDASEDAAEKIVDWSENILDKLLD